MYPQNSATASTLASDKSFTNRILAQAGVPTLGGEYFFLHDRHRAHRPRGHERDERWRIGHWARSVRQPLVDRARDFAQAVHGEAACLGISMKF